LKGENPMKNTIQISRRSFIKVSAIATGCVMLGFNLTRQAVAASLQFVGLRQKAAYDADAKIYKLRKSQDNPMVQKIYDKKKGFLKDGPCGEKSHKLLHTHYHDRSATVKALKATGINLKM
jgi:ferredoxin hydrogenase small subunit